MFQSKKQTHLVYRKKQAVIYCKITYYSTFYTQKDNKDIVKIAISGSTVFYEALRILFVRKETKITTLFNNYSRLWQFSLHKITTTHACDADNAGVGVLTSNTDASMTDTEEKKSLFSLCTRSILVASKNYG